MGQVHPRMGRDVERRAKHARDTLGDRRRSFRVHVPARATIWSKGEMRGQYDLRDLSIGGCLLQGPGQRPVGEAVDVMLHLPHRTALALGARVRRCTGKMLGLSFDAPTPRAEDCIQQLVFEAITNKVDPAVRKISLAIEPERNLRSDLVHALRELGQRAIGVATALDAVQILVEEGDSIGAAFIDLSSPSLPATELAEFIANNHPRVRRVLVGEPSDVAAAWVAEATGEVDGLLETPVHPDALRRLLARLGCTLRDAYVS